MAYKKTNWQDTLRDAQGNVIQKGTPLNAQALGKIEDGIVGAEQKIDNEISQVAQQLAQIAYSMEGLPSGETLDASPFIQSILNLARDNKVKKVVFPKNTYRLNSPIYIWGDDVEVDFSGSKLLSYANATNNKRAEVGIINAQGEMIDSDVTITTYLRSLYPTTHTPPTNAPVLLTFESIERDSAGTFRSTSRITTSNNGYFKIGDEVLIKGWTSNHDFPYNTSSYEPELHVLAKVINVDANYIYIDYYSPFRYPNFVDNSFFKSRVMKVRTIKNVKVSNVEIVDMTKIAVYGSMNMSELSQATCGISPVLVDGFRLENVTVRNFRQPAVYSYCGRNIDFKNVHGDRPQSWTVGGYAVCFMTSRDIRAENITGVGCRHIVDFSTGSNNAELINCGGVDDKSTSFMSHGQCEHDINYVNCSGTLGFGSGLAEFPNMNRNYQIDNCTFSLAGVVDGSKFTDNVQIKSSKIRMASNPAYFNMDIVDSEIRWDISNSNAIINTRGENVDTHFSIVNSKIFVFSAASTDNLLYNNNYNSFVLDKVKFVLAEGSDSGTKNLVLNNIKKITLNKVDSPNIRIRYQNTQHAEAYLKVQDCIYELSTNYFIRIQNLENSTLKLNMSGNTVRSNSTASFYDVLDALTGTRTNSRIIGHVHDNHFAGTTSCLTHFRYLDTDQIFSRSNIVENQAGGSKFTANDYIITA